SALPSRPPARSASRSSHIRASRPPKTQCPSSTFAETQPPSVPPDSPSASPSPCPESPPIARSSTPPSQTRHSPAPDSDDPATTPPPSAGCSAVVETQAQDRQSPCWSAGGS